MKKIFMMVMLMGMATVTIAQTIDNPGTPEERAKKITDGMVEALPLDSTQIKTVYNLNLKYAEKAQKEIIDKELGTWSMFRKGQKLNSQKEVELKPMLSESQWNNYLKLKSTRKKDFFNQLSNTF